MSPYRLRTYQLAHRATVVVLAGLGVAMGTAMILGGPSRFASKGFATAALVPGGVYMWGAILAASGIVTALGILDNWRPWVLMAGMALQGTWFAFFAVTLGIATYQDPHVAVTGPFAYTALALVCAIGYDTGRGLRQ